MIASDATIRLLCVVMKQGEEWPSTWTAQIGVAVRHARTRLGLSAEALSARCAEHGAQIPRNTITNLENGRKASMPLHELVVLAAALGIAPVELMCPVGIVERIRFLPSEEEASPYAVAQWIGGIDPLISWRDGRYHAPQELTPLALWRHHQGLLASWREADELILECSAEMTSIDSGERTTAEFFGLPSVTRSELESRMDAARRQQGSLEGALRVTRSMLRASGYLTPPVPRRLEALLRAEASVDIPGLQVGEPTDGQHPEA